MSAHLPVLRLVPPAGSHARFVVLDMAEGISVSSATSNIVARSYPPEPAFVTVEPLARRYVYLLVAFASSTVC